MGGGSHTALDRAAVSMEPPGLQASVCAVGHGTSIPENAEGVGGGAEWDWEKTEQYWGEWAGAQVGCIWVMMYDNRLEAW